MSAAKFPVLRTLSILYLLFMSLEAYSAPKNQVVTVTGASTADIGTSVSVSASASTKVTFYVNNAAICTINGSPTPALKNKAYSTSVYMKQTGECVVVASAVKTSAYNAASASKSITGTRKQASISFDTNPIGFWSEVDLRPTSANTQPITISLLMGNQSYCDPQFNEDNLCKGDYCGLTFDADRNLYSINVINNGEVPNNPKCTLRLQQNQDANYAEVSTIFEIPVKFEVFYKGSMLVTGVSPEGCGGVNNGSITEVYYHPAQTSKITSNANSAGFTFIGYNQSDANSWNTPPRDRGISNNFSANESNPSLVDHVIIGPWGSGSTYPDNNESNPTKIAVTSSSPAISTLDYGVETITLTGKITNPYNLVSLQNCVISFKYNGFLSAD